MLLAITSVLGITRIDFARYVCREFSISFSMACQEFIQTQLQQILPSFLGWFLHNFRWISCMIFSLNSSCILYFFLECSTSTITRNQTLVISPGNNLLALKEFPRLFCHKFLCNSFRSYSMSPFKYFFRSYNIYFFRDLSRNVLLSVKSFIWVWR